MKNLRLLIITIALFVTLALYACVPFFDGGHGGSGGGRGSGKFSEKQSLTNIDVYEYTVIRYQVATSFNL